MAEDDLLKYVEGVMTSGISIKEQKLIRDVLFEIYHLPLEDDDEEIKRARERLLREEQK